MKKSDLQEIIIPELIALEEEIIFSLIRRVQNNANIKTYLPWESGFGDETGAVH